MLLFILCEDLTAQTDDEHTNSEHKISAALQRTELCLYPLSWPNPAPEQKVPLYTFYVIDFCSRFRPYSYTEAKLEETFGYLKMTFSF